MTPENTNHTAGEAPSQQPDRESLSALFDGELDDAAGRCAIERLGHDARWRDACGRWQLAGDVMRRQQVGMAPAGFAERVEAAMANEAAMPGAVPGHAAFAATSSKPNVFALASRSRADRGRAGRKPPTTGARRRSWVTGGALAASVAVAALLVARPMLDDSVRDDPARPASLAGSTDSATAATPVARLQPTSPAASLASTPEATPNEAPTGSLADAGMAVAAAAVAAAKAPRAAAERRSRSQRQAAGSRQLAAASASRAPVRASDAETPAFGESADRPTVATAGSVFGPAESGSAHPFQPQPGEIQTRPWPRAMLPQASADTFTVGYDLRRGGRLAPSFYPFEPRMPSSDRVPVPADGRPLQFSEGPRP